MFRTNAQGIANFFFFFFFVFLFSSLANFKPLTDSSSLDSQFDQKSVNELNDHLYDSYDTLPNLKSKVEAPENSKNLLHKNKRASKFEDDNLVRAKHLILCLSNENLPFIDADSPGCSRYSNERIITMMPRNLLTSELNDWEKLKYMQKTYPSHKFIEVDVMDSQICQKCHRVLSFKKTYKCSMCDFTCHQHCVEKVSCLFVIFISFMGK